MKHLYLKIKIISIENYFKDVNNFSKIKSKIIIKYTNFNQIGSLIGISRPYIDRNSISDVLVDHGPRNKQNTLRYELIIAKALIEIHNKGLVVFSTQPIFYVIKKKDFFGLFINRRPSIFN